MAIGPAMIMGGLAILALATMGGGKKDGSAPAGGSGGGPTPRPLPSGVPSDRPGVDSAGFKRVTGPVPVMLPEALADLMSKSLIDLTVQENGSVQGPVTAEAVQRATTVAAQIDAAGFPEVAGAFREFIKRAAARVPSPAIDKQIPVPPGVSPALRDQINRAVQLERDPKKLGAILTALLNSAPPSKERDALAEMLSQAIKQTEAALVMADTLAKTQQVLNTAGPPPAATAPTPVITTPPLVVQAQPQQQSAPRPTVVLPEMTVTASEIPDTVEARRAVNVSNHLRNKVLDNGGDVKKAKGKEDKSMVKAFQLAEGATSTQADGLSGPTTTLKIAKYTGDIPPVYYWPKSATAKNVIDFRTTLLQMADVHENSGRPGVANKLRAAAARERGQGGITTAMPA